MVPNKDSAEDEILRLAERFQGVRETNDSAPPQKHPGKIRRVSVRWCGINLHKQSRKSGVRDERVATRTVLAELLI